MILHTNQALIAKDTHRFRVINCGRRFGKTVLASEEMLGVAIAKNDRRIAYYAPTRDDARDIMWSMLVKRLDPIITYKNDSRLELKIRTQEGGESMIVLYGWEAVQERGKGRGLSNDFIVLDEVASYRNFWEGWNEVLSPTLIDRKGSAMFISTPKGFNHFYDLYNFENKNEDYKSFHFTSYDNPTIPSSEIDRERATKPDDVFAQEYLGDFRKQEGLVFKEFNRINNTFDPDEVRINSVEKLAGIDFGYTNPCAIPTVIRDYDNNYWVTNEFYEKEKTEDQIAEYVAFQRFNKVYPDPENPSAIAALRKKGINVRDVLKNKDSIKNGIDKMRELFKNGKLKISKNCLNLIYELETYAYPEKKDMRNQDENPIKENDHLIDALRYVIYMQPEGYKEVKRQHIPQGLTRNLRPRIA